MGHIHAMCFLHAPGIATDNDAVRMRLRHASCAAASCEVIEGLTGVLPSQLEGRPTASSMVMRTRVRETPACLVRVVAGPRQVIGGLGGVLHRQRARPLLLRERPVSAPEEGAALAAARASHSGSAPRAQGGRTGLNTQTVCNLATRCAGRSCWSGSGAGSLDLAGGDAL